MLPDAKKMDLLRAFAKEEITFEDIIRELPSELRNKSDLARQVLEFAISRESPLDVEFGMVLLSSPLHEFYASPDIDQLCRLLLFDWHYSHEDIAVHLGKLRASEAVECLFSTASRIYEYLDYDETRQLAKKCIESLAQIGGKNAISRLVDLAGDNDQYVRRYARNALERVMQRN